MAYRSAEILRIINPFLFSFGVFQIVLASFRDRTRAIGFQYVR